MIWKEVYHAFQNDTLCIKIHFIHFVLLGQKVATWLWPQFSADIQKLCFVSSNVNIGDGVKINVGAQIHHDVSIEKYCTIAPRAVILGSVKIGKYTYVGANSTIKQNVKIGKNVIIGAGAVVVNDIKNNQIVAGNPAKKIKI